MVTTPGGTTAAGLAAMERSGLRAALSDGIVALTSEVSNSGRRPGSDRGCYRPPMSDRVRIGE